MAAGGDEVEVAADAGLGRVHVAEVVGAVDDPEFAVAGREVEDLLVVGQHDERRKAEFGMDRNDVLLAVLDDAGPGSAAYTAPPSSSERGEKQQAANQVFQVRVNVMTIPPLK